jgi:AcrR family transcriptional regulator
VAVSPARTEAINAILDAAEELLIEQGHAAITTRKLAQRAEVNAGLVHYYFGSMEEVLLQTLERFTARLTERQREMYAAPVPFIEKWRTAMHYLTSDVDAGYEKMWFEMQALGWNMPEVRRRVAAVFGAWHEILMQAFDAGLDELGVDRRQFPTGAVVALVMTFNLGVIAERLSGFDSGHAALLRMIDDTIEAAYARQQSEAVT